MEPVSLALTGQQHRRLQAHLFPGDGFEAVAFVLCGRRRGHDGQTLLAREIFPVPYEACSVRAMDQVTWSTDLMPPLLERARKEGLGLVKVHSHPTLYRRFSPIDDVSDRALFPAIHTWVDDDRPHGSAVMLADGTMFGRVVTADGCFVPLRRIRVAGDDLHFWPGAIDAPEAEVESAVAKRLIQSFGQATYGKLRRLRIAVIGCSGTGSIVVELLARNCVGELVLVDPKIVEYRNLNRIIQATKADADAKRLKVDVMERAINAMGTDVKVTKHAASLHHPAVLRDIAASDVVFGCMDTVDGRHTLNRLAAFYLLPYFDVGVKLVADGAGGIDQVVGTVHYLQPDGSSLLSRGVYTLEQVRAAALLRQNPVGYAARRKEGYIEGVDEERPAVVSVNTLYASLAVNEFLARLHPYRIEDNAAYAVHRLSLSHGVYAPERDGEPCALLARHVGRGDVAPLLDMPELSEQGGKP
jgi:hypothetical protein